MDELQGTVLGQKRRVPFTQAAKRVGGGRGRCEAKPFPASVGPFGIGRVRGGGTPKQIMSLAACRRNVLIKCSLVSGSEISPNKTVCRNLLFLGLDWIQAAPGSTSADRT